MWNGKLSRICFGIEFSKEMDRDEANVVVMQLGGGYKERSVYSSFYFNVCLKCF